jgi:hypothetical protein
MFCDQDDVWLPDKIEKMLKIAKSFEAENPAKPILTVSDLCVVDDNLKKLSPTSFWEYQRYSPAKGSGFNSMIVQNKFPGCSMMLNKKLKVLLNEIPQDAIMHDWWIALVASAFGRIAIIDEPLVCYRQHSINKVGLSENSLYGLIRRMLKNYKTIYKRIFLQKDFIELQQALSFRAKYFNMLNDKNKEILDSFCNLSILGILKNRIFIQPSLLNIRLFFVIILYKIRNYWKI